MIKQGSIIFDVWSKIMAKCSDIQIKSGKKIEGEETIKV